MVAAVGNESYVNGDGSSGSLPSPSGSGSTGNTPVNGDAIPAATISVPAVVLAAGRGQGAGRGVGNVAGATG